MRAVLRLLVLPALLVATSNTQRQCEFTADGSNCLAMAGRFHLPCARLVPGCTRPCGVVLFHIRGTGAKVIKGPGVSVFSHLYLEKEAQDLIEGVTYVSDRVKAKLQVVRARGGAVVTILR